jgi:hypothetical protein
MSFPQLLRVLRAGIAPAACTFFAAGLATSICQKGLGSSDAAGWVQAIGSVAAIVGAFAISNQQHQHAQRIRTEELNDERSRRCEIVKGILQKVQARLLVTDMTRANTPFAIALEGDVLALRATAQLVDSLPPFSMPSAQVLKKCLAISDQIGSVADILDTDRVDGLALRARPEGVEKMVSDLSSLLQEAISECDRVAAAQE